MNLTPKQIVEELNKYIIGQNEAKKAVAIALRNRYRRSKLPTELKEDITPKNIILKGPTGVGKTEIARRLAKIVKSPFVKVEATKFTEVGYVGRDCESMIRELVEVSVRMVKEERQKEVRAKVEESVNQKLFGIIYPLKKNPDYQTTIDEEKERVRQAMLNGDYDEEEIEVEVPVSKPKGIEIVAGGGEVDIGSIFSDLMPQSRKKKKVPLKIAKQVMIDDECNKLIDNESVNFEAIQRAEQEGIIFIDEIDKIAVKGNSGSNGNDVSREGVQRDILPFVEGCSVSTKYGTIKTDFILFIGAGAFHIADVQNLIPELQGRFPIRVELNNLTKDDFFKILKEPKNAMILQYKELLEVDNVLLEFTDDALEEIALLAEKENETGENLGARRLHTLLEKLLEDISFNASGDFEKTKVIINKQYVEKVFDNKIKSFDLNKYIL
ncbi:MAG: ATP-dependent protease ATPase subunit HslU [Clostridia bacterium]|nr:ATP-dependent protease ATPase subunit HslU [Clostridia bacterium]